MEAARSHRRHRHRRDRGGDDGSDAAPSIWTEIAARGRGSRLSPSSSYDAASRAKLRYSSSCDVARGADPFGTYSHRGSIGGSLDDWREPSGLRISEIMAARQGAETGGGGAASLTVAGEADRETANETGREDTSEDEVDLKEVDAGFWEAAAPLSPKDHQRANREWSGTVLTDQEEKSVHTSISNSRSVVVDTDNKSVLTSISNSRSAAGSPRTPVPRQLASPSNASNASNSQLSVASSPSRYKPARSSYSVLSTALSNSNSAQTPRVTNPRARGNGRPQLNVELESLLEEDSSPGAKPLKDPLRTGTESLSQSDDSDDSIRNAQGGGQVHNPLTMLSPKSLGLVAIDEHGKNNLSSEASASHSTSSRISSGLKKLLGRTNTNVSSITGTTRDCLPAEVDRGIDPAWGSFDLVIDRNDKRKGRSKSAAPEAPAGPMAGASAPSSAASTQADRDLARWSTLSVHAAIAAMEASDGARWCEDVAQEAANAVLEEARRGPPAGDMRDLATRVSSAVLGAGGSHWVAAAVSVALMKEGQNWEVDGQDADGISPGIKGARSNVSNIRRDGSGLSDRFAADNRSNPIGGSTALKDEWPKSAREIEGIHASESTTCASNYETSSMASKQRLLREQEDVVEARKIALEAASRLNQERERELEEKLRRLEAGRVGDERLMGLEAKTDAGEKRRAEEKMAAEEAGRRARGERQRAVGEEARRKEEKGRRAAEENWAMEGSTRSVAEEEKRAAEEASRTAEEEVSRAARKAAAEEARWCDLQRKEEEIERRDKELQERLRRIKAEERETVEGRREAQEGRSRVGAARARGQAEAQPGAVENMQDPVMGGTGSITGSMASQILHIKEKEDMLAQRNRELDEQARLNAEKEREINRRMAALDAAARLAHDRELERKEIQRRGDERRGKDEARRQFRAREREEAHRRRQGERRQQIRAKEEAAARRDTEIREAARRNARRERELEERTAALDAATSAAPERADDVQREIEGPGNPGDSSMLSVSGGSSTEWTGEGHRSRKEPARPDQPGGDSNHGAPGNGEFSVTTPLDQEAFSPSLSTPSTLTQPLQQQGSQKSKNVFERLYSMFDVACDSMAYTRGSLELGNQDTLSWNGGRKEGQDNRWITPRSPDEAAMFGGNSEASTSGPSWTSQPSLMSQLPVSSTTMSTLTDHQRQWKSPEQPHLAVDVCSQPSQLSSIEEGTNHILDKALNQTDPKKGAMNQQTSPNELLNQALYQAVSQKYNGANQQVMTQKDWSPSGQDSAVLATSEALNQALSQSLDQAMGQCSEDQVPQKQLPPSALKRPGSGRFKLSGPMVQKSNIPLPSGIKSKMKVSFNSFSLSPRSNNTPKQSGPKTTNSKNTTLRGEARTASRKLAISLLKRNSNNKTSSTKNRKQAKWRKSISEKKPLATLPENEPSSQGQFFSFSKKSKVEEI